MKESWRNKTVVIGLPARNEGGHIYKSLESIREAILFLGGFSPKIVVCVNGCKDDTCERVRDFTDKFTDVSVDLIMSEEGLVNAQRAVVESHPADIYVFPDADNVIARESVALLLNALEDDGVAVAYAKTVPELDSDNHSVFQTMGNLYDSQKMLTRREYFHGRLFATKDWFVPDNNELMERAKRTRIGAALLRYSKQGTLLYADDVYMSSYVMHKYGLNAIRQVEEAKCHSKPVGSAKDWWNSYRRRNIEMAKLHYWFPEFRYLAPHINRKTDWSNWMAAKPSDKIVWLLLLGMKAVFWVRLKIELAAVSSGLSEPKDQWQETLTTKRWKKD